MQKQVKSQCCRQFCSHVQPLRKMFREFQGCSPCENRLFTLSGLLVPDIFLLSPTAAETVLVLLFT